MTHRHLLSAIATILLLGTAPAWAEKDGTANEDAPIVRNRAHPNARAQQQGVRPSQRAPTQQSRANQRNDAQRGDNQRNFDQRNINQRGDQRYGGYQGPYYQAQRGDGRGAGPDHQYYHGDRLPPAYRSSHYVVDDWRGHQLSAPPRGYHWVQTGSDYVLIAIATGIILQMLLAN